MATTPVRRSGRERKQATSVYDEAAAKKQAEDKKKKEQQENKKEKKTKTPVKRKSTTGTGGRGRGGAAKSSSSARKSKRKQQEEDEDEDMVDASEDEQAVTEVEEESAQQEEQESDVQEEPEEEVESDDDDDDDDNDEDFEEETSPKAKAKSKRGGGGRKVSPDKKKKKAASKSASAKKPRGGGKGGGGKKIQVQVRQNKSKSKKAGTGTSTTKKTGGGKAAASGGRKGINSALANLAKKALEEDEQPNNSLVAGLLAAHKPDLLGPASTAAQKKLMAAAKKAAASSSGVPSTQPESVYTPNLTLLAKSIVSQHNADPNAAQIRLFNLIFRSVGGSSECCLNPNKHNLEEMNDEDWTTIVTDLVDEIRYAKPDTILVCADPLGAAHSASRGSPKSANKPTAASLGVREFRKIYEEFWYVLGGVALTDGGMANASAAQVSDDDEEESDNEKEIEEDESSDDETTDGEGDAESKSKRKKTTTKKKTKAATKKKKKASFPVSTTIRYDGELVRDLISRLMEINSVGQPDVRAAAVVAAYKMGQAVLDRTVHLDTRLDVAERQLKAAKKQGGKGGGASDKVESLQHQVDSLKRTLADLEEVVDGVMINGIFVHRYRDSCKYIRAASIDALSVMTLQRPDIFLRDKYLKYFGWMMSDKDEIVRLSAVSGLLAPFDAVRKAAMSSDVAALKAAERIDLTLMQHVVTKFMKRLADGVIDISVQVQEKAMALLLCLLREGFLDDVEDDDIWSQINNRSVAKQTSPAVRRDALYFVLEQLEAFDEGDDESDEEDAATAARRRRSTEPTSASESSDRRIAQRLDAVASWCAVLLTDGDVPMDHIQVELSDYLVHSLRAMPEHRSLVTTWSAMLRAIGDDNLALTSHGNAAGDRTDVAKQRVLVQMMAAAVKAEVGSVADPSLFEGYVDPEVISSEMAILSEEEVAKSTGKGAKRGSTGLQHESLSIALLKALPNLLVKFKTDSAITESLTTLPRYLLPTIFSLPQRKADFIALAKNLSEIFLQSSDKTVLENVALSLRFLSDGDHSRAPDGRLQLKNVSQELKDRLIDLFADDPPDSTQGSTSSKRKRSSTATTPSKRRRGTSTISSRASTADVTDDEYSGNDEASGIDEAATPADTEYGIYLNLMRLGIFFKRCDLSSYLQDEDGATSDNDDGVEALCSIIADGLAQRLKARKVTPKNDDDDDDDVTSAAKEESAWDKDEKNVAMTTAKAVCEGLPLLISATGWKLQQVMRQDALVVDDDDDDEIMDESREDDEDEEVEDHPVLRLRNRAIALVELCFEQFLDDSAEEDKSVPTYSKEQIAFSIRVQVAACQAASDLRTLFPKELADAASPLLRSFSMTNDGRLIGGFVRCFRSKENQLRESNDVDSDMEDKGVSDMLLLPLARTLGMNWSQGNRREAGVALAHITGSGHEASALVSSLSKILKKIDPVRYLEAQMASLRQSYEDWMENEPEEVESDHPTDEEMQAFDEAEKAHKSQFQDLEQQAWKLSQSLGVGKLSGPLAPALLGFVMEGVRFAFSNSDSAEDEDEWALGTRLSFLRILVKYANWAKKNKDHKETLRENLDEKEISLRDHPDFAEVHEEDLTALEAFRKALGLEPSAVPTTTDEFDDDTATIGASTVGENDHVTPSPSTAGRYSRGSTNRSRMSSVSGLRSLSPLIEKDSDDGSAGSGASAMDHEDQEEQDEDQIREETDEDESEDEEFSAPAPKKGKSYGRKAISGTQSSSQATFDPY